MPEPRGVLWRQTEHSGQWVPIASLQLGRLGLVYPHV